MNQAKKQCRQGDVFLIRVAAVKPKDALDLAADKRGIVLAEGETSGHHHAVFGDGAKLFRFRDSNAARVLVVGRAGAEIRVVGGESGGVPRHYPGKVAPGAWEVRTQRAWTAGDEARSRQVAD